MNIDFSNIENLLDLIKAERDLHLADVNWIEPVGIALLKQHKLAYPNINVTIQGESRSYVDTILNTYAKKDKSYVPLENFRVNNNNVNEIANNITKKIINNATNLSDSDKQDLLRYLQYLITEMMDNVISHSASDIGGIVTAQYYPTKKKVQVVIIDHGVGFLDSLSRKYPIRNEQEAILKALEKEVSGSNVFAPYTNVPKHAGLGLYFLSKIIEHTSGNLLIVSNKTLYRAIGSIFRNLQTDFRGTLIAFEIFNEKLDYEFGQLFNIIKNEGGEEEEEDIF